MGTEDLRGPQGPGIGAIDLLAASLGDIIYFLLNSGWTPPATDLVHEVFRATVLSLAII